jgi:hypothetical protein
MGERDVVWKHGENLFSGFKCKYCVKEFRGGGATRLKEYLEEKSGNVARCTKCPRDIWEYFLRELQRVRERKKVINDERYYAHADGGALRNAACATNVVVYLHVSWIICMYCVCF